MAAAGIGAGSAERAVIAELAAYMLVDADRNFVVLSL
jgi:hypothetical protein